MTRVTKNAETQGDPDPPEPYAEQPKVTMRVPSAFRRKFKIAAASHGMTETAVFIEAVEDWMKRHPNPE